MVICGGLKTYITTIPVLFIKYNRIQFAKCLRKKGGRENRNAFAVAAPKLLINYTYIILVLVLGYDLITIINVPTRNGNI